MIEPILCNIKRETEGSGIPGIDPQVNEEIIYENVPIKFKNSPSISMGKYGEISQGKITGYLPKGYSKIKNGDTVKGEGYYCKVIAPIRKCINYIVLELEKVR